MIDDFLGKKSTDPDLEATSESTRKSFRMTENITLTDIKKKRDLIGITKMKNSGVKTMKNTEKRNPAQRKRKNIRNQTRTIKKTTVTRILIQ